MSFTRGTQKVERVTVTLVPDKSASVPFNVPSTFDRVERVYEWKHSSRLDYLIVPVKISNAEIRIDLFVNPSRGSRLQAKALSKAIQDLVEGKVGTEWRGLRLAAIGRPSMVAPPSKVFVRGTIEDMLGVPLEH